MYLKRVASFKSNNIYNNHNNNNFNMLCWSLTFFLLYMNLIYIQRWLATSFVQTNSIEAIKLTPLLLYLLLLLLLLLFFC